MCQANKKAIIFIFSFACWLRAIGQSNENDCQIFHGLHFKTETTTRVIHALYIDMTPLPPEPIPANPNRKRIFNAAKYHSQVIIKSLGCKGLFYVPLRNLKDKENALLPANLGHKLWFVCTFFRDYREVPDRPFFVITGVTKYKPKVISVKL